ncbi:MAG: hypothetical protein ABSC20_06040 [Candidatus Bathyarchaeia archaeon]|jgi:hypothetical protein
MVSKAFTAIILTFNIIMSILFFIASQLVLLASEGFIIGHVGFFDIMRVSTDERGLSSLISNVPWVVLFFSLIVNVAFVVVLLRSKDKT